MKNRSGPPRTQSAQDHQQLRLGVVCAAVLVLVLAVTSVIYVLPIGYTTYNADLTEAQSVKSGDEVRLAGITVGKVTSLELRPDRVHMTFTVKRQIAVGDQSTLDIRMLTVVGGHYIALTPAGSKPLGDRAIPQDRIRLPYSLSRTLQNAAQPIAEVDGQTMRESVAALNSALTTTPDGLRNVGRAVDSLVSVLNQQQTQVSRALSVADEFLTVIDRNRSYFGVFVRKIGSLETKTVAKKAEITASLQIIKELMERIEQMEPTWQEVFQPVLHKLTEMGPSLQTLLRQLDQAVASLNTARDKIQSAISPGGGLTIDQSAVTLAAPAVCVPVPGMRC
ncbi:MlaD family protein [Nocardia vaccinii]|uniref:MlaD family protein n=1 Tax=Nocardia vaccinii TaxID=1822 RepID=UPI00082A3E3E|nr:MlaD family protein [Nocardia vaccinii]